MGDTSHGHDDRGVDEGTDIQGLAPDGNVQQGGHTIARKATGCMAEKDMALGLPACAIRVWRGLLQKQQPGEAGVTHREHDERRQRDSQISMGFATCK
jgi:hypothetical protein